MLNKQPNHWAKSSDVFRLSRQTCYFCDLNCSFYNNSDVVLIYRRPEKWEELGGLQSGLSLQHCGADLHREQQPAADHRRPGVTTDRAHWWDSCPWISPDPFSHCYPGPQSDLPSPINPQTLDNPHTHENTHTHTHRHWTESWQPSLHQLLRFYSFLLPPVFFYSLRFNIWKISSKRKK